MQFRNGLRSVRRSPLKSLLFFVLVAALTVIVILGATLVYTSERSITRCAQDYLTTVVMEYEGNAYPNQDVRDERSASMQQEIDFAALAQDPTVLSLQKAQTIALHIPEFETIRRNMKAYTSVVLEVMVFSMSDDESTAMCLTTRTLYSTTIKAGRMIYLSLDELTELGIAPQLRDRYLICGTSDGKANGNSAVSLQDILPGVAVADGVTLASPLLVLESTDYKRSDPAFAPFFDIADAYKAVNESRYGVVASDPSVLREFTQNEYLLKQGSFYTPADCADGRLCCLLPEDVASRCNLKVGDTVSMEAFSVAQYTLENAYWSADENKRDVSCYVSGIYGSDVAETLRIYISDTCGVEPGLIGYQLGTMKLKNGTTNIPALPGEVKATLLDQGYVGVDRSLRELRASALWLLAISVFVALALLVLFAFLFVGRQAEALQTMKMLGTTRRSLRRYVLFATGAVLLPAAALSCPAALSCTGILNKIFERMTSADTSFSTTGLSVIKPLVAPVQMPWWLLGGCAGAIACVGVLLSFVFLRLSLRDKKPKLRKTSKRAPREYQSSMQKNPARKYITLSILRGGARSAAVPILCLLLAVFQLILGYTEQHYRLQRKQLDKDTELTGYFTDYTGKYRTNLVLTKEFIDALEEDGLVTDIVPFCQSAYLFSGEITAADGTVRAEMTVSVPNGSFAYESFIGNLAVGPKLMFTSDVLTTGGFDTTGKQSITWLDGYDEGYFNDESKSFEGVKRFDNYWYYYSNSKDYYTYSADNRELCCVVPARFLEENGAELGESVTLLSLYGDELTFNSYKLIGSYESKSAGGTIYTRMDSSATIMTTYLPYSGGYLNLMEPRDSYSGGMFRLDDTARLQAVKKAFAEKGYSAVRTTGRYRFYPVFEDSEYLNAAKKLESSLSFMRLLHIAATVLTAACGFVAAYLMSAKRKTELAVIRAQGASDKLAFRIFFYEQLLLCLLGTLTGILLWRLAAPWSLLSLTSVSFAAGFLLATALSLRKASRADLLSVLSEKE